MKILQDRGSSSLLVLIIALCQVKRHNRDIFSSFSNMMVCCVFLLESPHRGDSNEYTQHTIINIKRKSPEIISNTIISAAMFFFFC